MYRCIKYRSFCAPGVGQILPVAYLSLITESRHWSSAKCWHKMSQTCRWPFWVSQSRAGARYKSWQSMWLKLFLLDISGTPAHRFLAFQSRHHEKMSPFYLLGGIHQLNMTLRPGHDSFSLPLPRPLTSQHTQTLEERVLLVSVTFWIMLMLDPVEVTFLPRAI